MINISGYFSIRNKLYIRYISIVLIILINPIFCKADINFPNGVMLTSEFCKNLGYSDIRICAQKQNEILQDHNRSTRDLLAQENMALSASYTNYISIISFIITAIGTILIYFTLVQTKAAINLDREVGHAQVRAYLSIVPKNFPYISDFDEHDVRSCPFNIKNSGQSPAINLKYRSIIFMECNPFESDPNEIMMKNFVDWTIEGHIPSGDDRNMYARAKPEISYHDYKSHFGKNDRLICMFIQIEYDTIFGKKCHTDYYGYLSKDHDSFQSKNGTASPRFHRGWIIINKYNSAD